MAKVLSHSHSWLGVLIGAGLLSLAWPPARGQGAMIAFDVLDTPGGGPDLLEQALAGEA